MNSNEQKLFMPANNLNNLYEQILQRNLTILNQQNMFPTNLNPQQALIEYQVRCQTLMNSVRQTCLPINIEKQQKVENHSKLIKTETCLHKSNELNSNVAELPKPTHSYIGLIALAILSTPEKKIVLSDIYQWILDNYLYFRNRGPGWRNSIRHNLSLNDCFIKCGRSVNGKGHYWTIHPANFDDFSRGDFRRRRAQRRVRKSLGLTGPGEDEEEDDEEYEEHGDEEEITISSASSKSPKVFEKSIFKRKSFDCEEEIMSSTTHIKKRMKPNFENFKNGSTDDNISISEHSTSDYNTTSDDIETEVTQPTQVIEEIVVRQKRSFDVDALLAPDVRKPKKIKTFHEPEEYKLTTPVGILIDSASSSLSSSTVSSPSSPSTTFDSSLNINQSLLNAQSYYHLLSNNNPPIFYLNQLPQIRFNKDEEQPKAINKKKEEKKSSTRKNDSNSDTYKIRANEIEKNRIQSSNIDVEKWNETFSKIMARSYKNHNNVTISAINKNCKRK